jgi:hypothetical protein
VEILSKRGLRKTDRGNFDGIRKIGVDKRKRLWYYNCVQRVVSAPSATIAHWTQKPSDSTDMLFGG